MIKIIISGDSPDILRYVKEVIGKADDFTIGGVFSTGAEAIKLAQSEKPDIVLIDVSVSQLDPVKVTRKIQKKSPSRIVLLSSSWDSDELEKTFTALKSGALTVFERPEDFSYRKVKETGRELIQTLESVAEIPLHVLTAKGRKQKRLTQEDAKTKIKFLRESGISDDMKVIALGASIGGIALLYKIVSNLPIDFPIPIIAVTGISSGFATGLAEWLSQATTLPISVASHGDMPEPAHIYLAPGDQHIGITREGRIHLEQGPPVNQARPSISRLFLSVCQAFKEKSTGILLTYLGLDGIKELKHIKDSGGLAVVQNIENSAADKILHETDRLESATLALAPQEIVSLLPLLAKKIEEDHQEEPLLPKGGIQSAGGLTGASADAVQNPVEQVPAGTNANSSSYQENDGVHPRNKPKQTNRSGWRIRVAIALIILVSLSALIVTKRLYVPEKKALPDMGSGWLIPSAAEKTDGLSGNYLHAGRKSSPQPSTGGQNTAGRSKPNLVKAANNEKPSANLATDGSSAGEHIGARGTRKTAEAVADGDRKKPRTDPGEAQKAKKNGNSKQDKDQLDQSAAQGQKQTLSQKGRQDSKSSSQPQKGRNQLKSNTKSKDASPENAEQKSGQRQEETGIARDARGDQTKKVPTAAKESPKRDESADETSSDRPLLAKITRAFQKLAKKAGPKAPGADLPAKTDGAKNSNNRSTPKIYTAKIIHAEKSALVDAQTVETSAKATRSDSEKIKTDGRRKKPRTDPGEAQKAKKNGNSKQDKDQLDQTAAQGQKQTLSQKGRQDSKSSSQPQKGRNQLKSNTKSKDASSTESGEPKDGQNQSKPLIAVAAAAKNKTKKATDTGSNTSKRDESADDKPDDKPLWAKIATIFQKLVNKGAPKVPGSETTAQSGSAKGSKVQTQPKIYRDQRIYADGETVNARQPGEVLNETNRSYLENKNQKNTAGDGRREPTHGCGEQALEAQRNGAEKSAGTPTADPTDDQNTGKPQNGLKAVVLNATSTKNKTVGTATADASD